ncbi:MATE efflux family protein [[Clostridium] sordellii]|uniref:Multidrug export protein MepA n=1 Tax=Paraclostridium sordellii TaxID=1505 RepID=A0ABM9RQ46_PARSO|nr:MATE family efflux transporter [Paeniclostridium sordellii]CEJ74175.1 putative drug/sodium antiporter, MATE family [[Clostridium] sordellii] [Paeniclostridium sordellii]CEN69719.1 MATE efflux family protein [[Clostridium] sordellii] [Paeniclostridium sordellii]CEN72987.1 MATE efflux family protein [[Clostridium] sordellii] [Paeniclostridium sordellii]CEO25450.1 MATE efflux family protein [[Clostridium] sordellii] [Paeniclostridium sordellii]CEP75420.1 MATE efflux family protein [[Clostridiu
MENQQTLKEEKISKLLLKYSVPAILAMMVASLYNTVDRAFIGSIKDVGALAISGLGVTMPLFTILGAFCVAIAVGGSTNISIKLGEGNKEEAEKILGNTFLLELIVGISIMVIGTIFLEDILYIFGASNDTLKYAKEYMSVILFGAWFNLPGFALNSAIRADGRPKLAANMMIVSCILNLILDPIFIFWFDMGIQGAAIGTIICQLVICIWSMHYFTRGKSNLKLKVKNIKIKFNILKPIIVIALTPFFMELASGSIHLVTNRVLKIYGGDLSIGAMAAITSICLMFLMPVFGLSQGMQTIIAYNYGAKEYDRARKVLFSAIIAGTIILTLGFVLIKIYPEKFIGIFTNDDKLISLALNGIKIYSITLPIIGISILGTVYFQSIGSAKVSMVLGLLRQVIILIPVILVVPKIYGLDGVWMSQPIADLGAMIVVGLFLIRDIKIRRI